MDKEVSLVAGTLLFFIPLFLLIHGIALMAYENSLAGQYPFIFTIIMTWLMLIGWLLTAWSISED